MTNSHADLLKRLLPPVALNPNGARIAAELEAAGIELDRASTAIGALLEEADPRTATALFAEWEQQYGLPDSCIGGEQTSAERRAHLVALDGMVTGPTKVVDLVALAAEFGYVITIEELYPYTTESTTEDPVTDEQWHHVFQVNAPLVSFIERTTEDDTEMPTAIWGNQRLECVINRYKQAHQFAHFVYV